ncbi:MAG: PRD domain-containing protein [Lachnospiraceae bacterium]|nr:PRD domain-containing protein [Lachnospiraceae bacterium]
MDLKDILNQRLDILEENHVICKEVADYSRKVVERILEERPNTEEDKAAMFITHLAMAGQRVLDGVVEPPLDNLLLNGIKKDSIYQRAEALKDELLNDTDIQFPEVERDFLTIHLCNLLS